MIPLWDSCVLVMGSVSTKLRKTEEHRRKFQTVVASPFLTAIAYRNTSIGATLKLFKKQKSRILRIFQTRSKHLEYSKNSRFRLFLNNLKLLQFLKQCHLS